MKKILWIPSSPGFPLLVSTSAQQEVEHFLFFFYRTGGSERILFFTLITLALCHVDVAEGEPTLSFSVDEKATSSGRGVRGRPHALQIV